MCGDNQFELDYKLKCKRCGKKPAVELLDIYTGKPLGKYSALCERCGIEISGADVVADWAGTELYLRKYPDQIDVWR